MAATAPDFFGTPDDVTRLRASLDTADAAQLTALAWFMRQRDTHEALRLAERAAAALGARDDGAALAARLMLVRGEAAWLFNRLDEANTEQQCASAAFAALHDAVGAGDAELLRASLLDHVGGDRLGAIQAARVHFERAGDTLREQLAATWAACVQATADPDDAESRWGGVLRDPALQQHAGLATYVAGALGTLAWRRSDPAGAIEHFQRGVEMAQRAGQIQSAVSLAQNVGIAYSTLNDHEGALTWVERARSLVQPTGWPHMIGWCLMQTGSVLLGLKRADAAMAILLEGMPTLQGTEGSRNHALACQILAEAALELQRNEEALAWSNTALQGALKLPYPDLLSGTLRFKALALARLGRADEAAQAAAQALDVAEHNADWQRAATAHHVLAEIARTFVWPAPAGAPAASGTIHHLQQALAVGARMQGFQPPPEWWAELSSALEDAGDPVQALAAERSASQARARAQARHAQDLATALMVRHRTERAEAEAQRQRASAEASELRAQLLQTQAALEKERMQSLLVHAGKMVAVGRLASGVVHEMSHPVGTLLLLTEALAERLSNGDTDVRDTLRTLHAETRRLQQFVGRLRDFARAEPPRLAAHSLRSVMADARQLFAPRLGVERVAYHEDLPELAVQVDPQRLALAVANLVFNAADAMAGHDARTIRVHAAADAGAVALHVDDSGPGLTAAVHERLFEPFFTTKPEGKGLGLGLALSAESLAAMGGHIHAANRAEGGARFTITLRAA
ncbi:MAG TPA: ATP-binding protein [Burkholderiaceae bacterium]